MPYTVAPLTSLVVSMLLRMLANPLEVLTGAAQDKELGPEFIDELNFGCSVTLAGCGYPYVQIQGPRLPVEVEGPFDCDVWWNEVTNNGDGELLTTGHRIADVIGFGRNLDEAIAKAYANIRRIRSLGSYYRPDIGRSLWPPGRD